MMVEKIEKFNRFGTMEGATTIGTKHFTSMKQDVLDLCESRYDAKIKKCCEEQSVEVSVKVKKLFPTKVLGYISRSLMSRESG